MNNRLNWLSKWALRASGVIGGHLIVQFLNGVVALMLVRSLDKKEYGWLTISTGMAAVLSALSDSGIASAVTSNGGSVWKDRKRLSALVHAALLIVRTNTLIVSSVVSAILVGLLSSQGAPRWVILSMLLLVVGPQSFSARTMVLNIINRLHSRIWQMQQMEMAGAIVRFTFTLVPAVLGFINIHIAMGAVALSVFLQYLLVKRGTKRLLDANSLEEDRRRFRESVAKTMKQIYPSAVFHCLHSQLATSLLALFGNGNQVADLGALSRLGFISNLISAPLASLVAPAFARCEERKRLISIFCGVVGGYMMVFAGVVLFIYRFSEAILLFLGDGYQHLAGELRLYAISMVISFLSQLFWALNFARGWVSFVWLNVPLTLVVQIIGTLTMEVGSVRGAILLITLSSFPGLSLGAVSSFVGFKRMQNDS